MDARLEYDECEVAQKFIKHLVSASGALRGAGLPEATTALVEVRVSQINGCAVCVDMHTKDAEAHGETSVRLHLVAAWREAVVFTEAERAALELAEELTRIADASGGVSDEVWDRAARHYGQEQMAALVCLIAMMNAWNRMNVGTRQPAGDYQPGQWG